MVMLSTNAPTLGNIGITKKPNAVVTPLKNLTPANAAVVCESFLCFIAFAFLVDQALIIEPAEIVDHVDEARPLVANISRTRGSVAVGDTIASKEIKTRHTPYVNRPKRITRCLDLVALGGLFLVFWT